MSLLGLMKNTGCYAAIRAFRQDALTVLTAHGVVPPASQLPWQPLREQVDVETFARQIDVISQHHEWVDLDGALRHLRGEHRYRNPVLMTFDDGYRNNLDIALPVLEAQGIKPLLFVTTGYLNNARPFWFDRFDYVIQQIDRPWTLRVDTREFTFRPGVASQMARVYQQLRGYAKRKGWEDHEFHDFFSDACRELESYTGKSLAAIQADDPWSATVSGEQLRDAVHRNAIDVGSHTIDHMRIDKLNPQDRMRQLVESRRILEEITGKPCISFCYPNGDWDHQSTVDVAQAGYQIAFSVDGGLNRPGTNLYTIRRVFVPTRFSEAQVEALSCGALSLKENFNNWLSSV
ncbi:MAG: polysaccharide deacetylase family protein [Pseudomonadales bacterium]|nr:polysaccharide deacetylase family protein [Pseudomonadales bacterium]